MRIHWLSAVSSFLFLTSPHLSSTLAHALGDDDVLALQSVANRFITPNDITSTVKRDDHGHHHHGAPLTELNETEILLHHAPTPPSYYTVDWEGDSLSEPAHPGLIVTHAVLLGLAFFVALPAGIALRSVSHAAYRVTMFVFYGLYILGISASALYNKVMPNMYQGSKHALHGYILLFFALVLSAFDLLALLGRLVTFIRCGERLSPKAFWVKVVLGRKDNHNSQNQAEVDVHDADDYEEQKLLTVEHDNTPTSSWVNHQRTSDESPGEWSDHPHNRSEGTLFLPQSPSSEATFHELEPCRQSSKPHLLHRIGQITLSVLERSLVFGGYVQFISGIVIYTGGCRGTYINGCLAHLIKGSIFWTYGLLTFARFLGSFAEFGWAWNRPPSPNGHTAEWVESFVIFVYGATNMWMERFGAHPGDPFTTKQIQHISIADRLTSVLGMGIESRRIRTWLASSTSTSLGSSRTSQEAIAEPLSYIASFNPFPALVIGVTGAAMAAHAQTYLFQVQIHQLWGNSLVAFSVLRSLTYFFLWLGPPRSILPSRPPTEALAGFFLACGGLVFMFSTEEVTLAAMRRGRDDVMMFLNVAVAITCLALCWTLLVVGFKGWLKSRNHPKITFHSSD
ncbi:hypothetical protein BDN72DRAFT_891903 [Pluteus cervinus]|uniref:Uncharacterized protein n=1 Tax=Pluteus cervinus TaxID=181527 RepID=A0ACD3BEG8_9AGAR|nr:hypothetical protein BDN72DRAFT_891903 [Pluteus cervinus]